jgi:predicted O-linked N-acetylglucosamine transferase (SPINDLY family)
MQEKLLQELLITAAQLYTQGELTKADETIAEVLKFVPAHPQALHLRGLILHMSGDIVSAIKLISEAIAINPTQPIYLKNFCSILLVAGQVTQAIEAGRRAVALDDTNPGILACLAHALMADHQYDAALSLLEKVASLESLSVHDLNQGLTCARKVADFSDTYKWMERIANYFSPPESPPLSSVPTSDLINLAYADVTAPLPLGIYAHVINTLETRFKSISFTHDHTLSPPSHSQRTKIGYLSGGFGDNPIGHVIHDLFRHHDRSRFEVHIFSNRNRDDEKAPFARKIREECDHYHNLSLLSPRDAALKIRQAGIDILIYLDGFLSNSGPLIMAQRPAARQYFWLGHAGTLGLSCIDATIADSVALPANERSRNERVIDLAGCYHCASPLEAVEFVDPNLLGCRERLRAEQAQSALPFVFCGFNNPEKINAEVFHVWMEILRAVPYSVLWLSNQFNCTALEKNLCSAAKECGVDDERLVFAGRLPSKKEHLGRHKQADLLLDTFSHTASTTALDALWMGVPIITLKGHRFSSRICSDFLTNLKLSELICSSPKEYIQKAIALAQDPTACNTLKIKVAAAVKSSDLFKP